MNNSIFYLLIILCAFTLFSCEEDQGVKGDLQLAEITAIIDDHEVIAIPVTGFVPTVSESIFTYKTKQGSKDGTWEFNDDKTILKVTFESQSFEYSVNSYSPSEFTFVAHIIDLQGTFAKDEQEAILFINQKLVEIGSDYNQMAYSGNELVITFTLRYK